MKAIRNLTLGLAVVVCSVPMFAGQRVDQNRGLSTGKRMYTPVTVAPPSNGKGQTGAGQPGMAVHGSGVPEHGDATKPQPQPAVSDTHQHNSADGAAKGQATE